MKICNNCGHNNPNKNNYCADCGGFILKDSEKKESVEEVESLESLASEFDIDLDLIRVVQYFLKSSGSLKIYVYNYYVLLELTDSKVRLLTEFEVVEQGNKLSIANFNIANNTAELHINRQKNFSYSRFAIFY